LTVGLNTVDRGTDATDAAVWFNDKETGYTNYIGKEINTNNTPAAVDTNFFKGFMFLVGMSNYGNGQ
jgi:hypothetical protein